MTSYWMPQSKISCCLAELIYLRGLQAHLPHAYRWNHPHNTLYYHSLYSEGMVRNNVQYRVVVNKVRDFIGVWHGPGLEKYIDFTEI